MKLDEAISEIISYKKRNVSLNEIGQALYYGKMTNRQPACVLIMENPEKDTKYLNRLRRAVYRKGLDMRTFTIKPEHLNIPAVNCK